MAVWGYLEGLLTRAKTVNFDQNLDWTIICWAIARPQSLISWQVCSRHFLLRGQVLIKQAPIKQRQARLAHICLFLIILSWGPKTKKGRVKCISSISRICLFCLAWEVASSSDGTSENKLCPPRWVAGSSSENKRHLSAFSDGMSKGLRKCFKICLRICLPPRRDV